MMFALVSVAFGGDPCSESPEVLAQRSAEIMRIYEEGDAEAADRTAAAKTVLERDLARVDEMEKIANKGWLCSSSDKWHAAWVLLRDDELATIQRGRDLAIETMEAREPRGAWLVAFAHDRVQVVQGRKQTYGSQTSENNEGKLCLVEIDD